MAYFLFGSAYLIGLIITYKMCRSFQREVLFLGKQYKWWNVLINIPFALLSFAGGLLAIALLLILSLIVFTIEWAKETNWSIKPIKNWKYPPEWL